MAATYTAKAVFKAIDKMTRPFRQMAKGARNFAQKADIEFARVERRMRKLGKSVGKLGFILGAGFLFTVLTSSINVFKDFEQANASLASVMSSATGPELQELQKDAKRLGATTAKTATEVVGLQEAFARLGFGAKDIINMTESTISGSIAMQGELADTTELVGAMVKSFDAFESVNAPNIIDQMTLATQKSALNFEKLQTGLPIVAGAANAAGVEFTTLLASMGKLSDAGIDASSSSTALRNIFIEAAKQGKSYKTLLKQVSNSTDQLATANKLFGKRGAVAAVILAKNMKGVTELDEALKKANGTADIAAKKQLNTLGGALTILQSAWEGFILSVEDGNGKLGQTLKTIVHVATEMLSMASGTAKAGDQLTDGELRIRKFAETGMKMLKVIKWIVISLTALKVATVIYSSVMKIATAAQWLLNIAMSLNPVGLIIVGIIALIAVVTIIIKKWHEWGAALAVFLGPLGFLISVVQAFRENWELVKASFAQNGILKGLLTIGKVLLDAILMPVQQLLEMLGKIPGLNIAARGAEGIGAFRERLFEVERNLLPKEQLSTTKATSAQESISREERISKQQATLNINNNTGFQTSVDSPDSFPIQLSQTN